MEELTEGAAFLDFDGLLIDNILRICYGVGEVLRHYGAEPPDTEYMLKSLTAPYEQWFRAHGVPAHATLTEIYAVYDAKIDPHVDAPLMPNARAFLSGLRRRKLRRFIVSASAHVQITRVIEREQITHFIDGIVGDAEHTKAEAITKYIEEHKLDRARCYMFGDRPSDIEAGNAANVTTVAFTRGYGTETFLRTANPHHVIHDLLEFFPKID